MKHTNSFHTISQEKPKWEETPDGFLRCRARVLAERVMPYARQELAEVPDDLQTPIVQMLVDKTTMGTADSIRSLEGMAIVAGDHAWLDPEVIKTYQVGQVAGTPVLEGPYLVCDLMVTDPTTIQDIKDGKLVEISAAYLADTVFEQGDFDGVHYDAKQVQLRYNHIAILPPGHGRAGTDVRIINKKRKGADTMADEKKVVRVRLGNTGRFVNTDKEGAAAIAEEEKATEGASDESGKKLEQLMKEAEEAKASADAANAELEELKGELSVYKEKLDELLSTEAIEHAAMGMVAEQAEAEEIIENACQKTENEKDEDFEKRKEEVSNSIKGVHGSALHSKVLTACGVKCENMSPEALRGAFKAQAQIANSQKGRRSVSGSRLMNNMAPGPKDVVVNQSTVRTANERLGFPKK